KTRVFDEPDPFGLEVEHPAFEQSNTMTILGRKWVLKGYRQLQEGINPEIEIGRFLTETSPFPHIAPVAGAFEYRDASGRATALGLLQAYVDNQGSGWNYTVEYLKRFLDSMLASGTLEGALTESAPPPLSLDFCARGPHAAFLALVALLGRRTGELHVALGVHTGDAAFDPEPVSKQDLERWAAQVRSDVELTLG